MSEQAAAAEPPKKVASRFPLRTRSCSRSSCWPRSRRGSFPQARTTSTPRASRSRGRITRWTQKPSRILVDSLTAPINGLYGIEDAKGNINYYNSGTLFGAIDIALFIIVIGGFLGVTMKTGAIQAGIGRLVARMQAGSAD